MQLRLKKIACFFWKKKKIWDWAIFIQKTFGKEINIEIFNQWNFRLASEHIKL